MRERAATHTAQGTFEYVAPLAATFGHTIKNTFWDRRKVASLDAYHPIGIFETYICRKCGFTEFYARDAAAIPIGPEFGTEEFVVDSGTPFR